jgi:hypothetical protein
LRKGDKECPVGEEKPPGRRGRAAKPKVPEPIRNGDGEEKQDYGQNAGKMRLRKHRKEYARLSPTFSGDDLYANRSFCEAVLKEKLHFIFVRNPGSHPRLYEMVARKQSRYLVNGNYDKTTGMVRFTR